MARSGADPNGPEDVDAAFAEIVADLEREGFGEDVAADQNRKEPDTSPQRGSADHPSDPPSTTHASTWRVSDTEWDWAESSDTEHYVPPEPPPLPKLRIGTVIAIVLTVFGVFLLIAPGLIGLPLPVSAPLAVVLLVSGVGLLLLRLRSGPPRDGTDDGAQL